MELISDKIKIKDLLELKRNNMITVNPEYKIGIRFNRRNNRKAIFHKIIDGMMNQIPNPIRKLF